MTRRMNQSTVIVRFSLNQNIECSKMKKILCLLLVSIICLNFLLADETNEAFCFKYRWVEPIYENISMYNCSDRKGIPCIEPLVLGEKPPNTTELWELKNDTYYRPLLPSSVCIKYTYIFDNKIVNTTSFLGKVVEEGLGPITTGCYQQYVNGYIIEMCACLSRIGKEPCNASMKLKYSNTLVIMLSFFISVIRLI